MKYRQNTKGDILHGPPIRYIESIKTNSALEIKRLSAKVLTFCQRL